MKRKFEEEVEKKLRRSGARRLLVGVSGGADSTAMLLALCASGAEIVAIHCNFHLRGDESNRDCEAAKALCKRLGVKFRVIDFDVELYRRSHAESVETACRNLRYAEFRKLKAELNIDRICVAHNADDQAETLLLNLFRGAGCRGLGGMREDTGEILRPLLWASRAEILQYLTEAGEDFVTDSSNASNEYRRNFLRNELLPAIETRWQGARDVLARTAERMQADEQALEAFYRQHTPSPHTLDYATLRGNALWRWVVARFAYEHGANSTQSAELAEAIRPAVTLEEHSPQPYGPPAFQAGKIWKVKEGTIEAGRDAVRFIPTAEEPPIRITTRLLKHPDEIAEAIAASGKERLITTLSPDAIEFRRPLPGDRIEPLGMKGSMLISKVMKDARLSFEEKKHTILAIEKVSGRIIWGAGLKRSRHHLLPPDAKMAYEYRVENEEK